MNLGQPARFAIVGLTATLVHAAAGQVLIDLGVGALAANPAGFALAFAVSLIGHHSYSFRGHRQPMARVVRRFCLIALTGLALNEALLAILLTTADLPGPIALPLATLAVAATTFLLSRHWAFAAPPGASIDQAA